MDTTYEDNIKKLLASINPGLLKGRQEIRSEEYSAYRRVQWKEPYYNPERKIEGIEIPHLTTGVVQDALGHVPLWSKIVTAERVGPLFVESEGKRVSMEELDADSKQTLGMRAIEAADRTVWVVPALVKNFMVIIRTIPLMSGKLRVLVRGSRAMHSGGQWQTHVMQWLLRTYSRVDMDLFDPNEEEGILRVEFSDRIGWVRRYQKEYSGTGKGYDACIDDAYIPLVGTVPWIPDCTYWSKKDHSGSYDPYLHPKEGREFSHSRVGIRSPCTCQLCNKVAECSEDANAFFLLRTFCTELGASTCAYEGWKDTVAKRNLILELRNGPVAVTKDTIRKAKQVAGIMPLSIVNGLITQDDKGLLQPKDMNSSLLSYLSSTAVTKGWWEQSRLIFVGVAPDIVAGEMYRPSLTQSSFSIDPNTVTFAASSNNLTSSTSEVVWCPEILVGYKQTGRQHRNYVEQVRVRVIKPIKFAATFASDFGMPIPGKLTVKDVIHMPVQWQVTIDQLRHNNIPIEVYGDGPPIDCVTWNNQVSHYGRRVFGPGAIHLPEFDQFPSVLSGITQVSCTKCKYLKSTDSMRPCREHCMVRLIQRPIEAKLRKGYGGYYAVDAARMYFRIKNVMHLLDVQGKSDELMSVVKSHPWIPIAGD